MQTKNKVLFEVTPDRQDAAWYCYDYSCVVAEVTLGERTAEVLAVGEMRIHIPYENEDGSWDENKFDVVRYTDELEQYAKNDAELLGLTEKWSSRGYDIWVNNNWFEVVEIIDGVADSDCWDIYHEFENALCAAEETLMRVEA